jgi:AraC-like DNA-binding protein
MENSGKWQGRNSSTLTLDQIAHRAGYRHTQNMVELFKKKFGQTPGTYRRSAQGGARST